MKPCATAQMEWPWSWPCLALCLCIIWSWTLSTIFPDFFAILLLIRFSQWEALVGWEGQLKGRKEEGICIPLCFWLHLQKQWSILWFQQLQWWWLWFPHPAATLAVAWVVSTVKYKSSPVSAVRVSWVLATLLPPVCSYNPSVGSGFLQLLM